MSSYTVNTVRCETFIEYCYACVSRTRSPTDLPVILGETTQHSLSNIACQGNLLGFKTLVDKGELQILSAYWEQLDWKARCELVVNAVSHVTRSLYDASRTKRPRYAVVVNKGESAVCGAFLASYLKASVHVVQDDLARDAVEKMHNGAKVIVIALSSNMMDSLFIVLLSEFQSLLNSDLPWGSFTVPTLVTRTA